MSWLPGALPALSRHETLVLYLGTARAKATVQRLGDDTAHLYLERALPCEGGLGVVLRGAAARRDFGRVVGGGRVLDALAPRPPRRRDTRAWELRSAALSSLARGDVASGLLALLEARAPRPIVEGDIERRLGLEPGHVASLLATPRCRDLALPLADHQSWTTQQAMGDLLAAAVGWLERYHAQTPHELGPPLETLRAALAELAGREAAEHAVDLALRSGRIRAVDAGRVSLPEFAERTAPARDEALDRVRRTLDALALDGASEQEIAQRSSLSIEMAHAALAGLAKMDEARRLSGLWFGERELGSLRAAVRAHLQKHATMSVPQFKELFGLSRKQAIPLLEDLDHRGVTRRQGDERVLGPAKEP